MKKFILLLVVVAMLSVMFVGCAEQGEDAVDTSDAGAADATDADATDANAGAADADPDDPIAGLAVDENGDPYVIGYVGNEARSNWMASSIGFLGELWERAGGEFYSFVSESDMQLELSQMDDLMELDPDIIFVHPSDPHAIVPAVEKAREMGIPVVAIDMGVNGTDVDCYIHLSQSDLGVAQGNYMSEHFSEDNPGVVLELTGDLTSDTAKDRSDGFHSVVDGIDYIEVVQQIDTKWTSENAMDGVFDAFERRDDINAICVAADCLTQGVIEGLRQKDKLFPVGEDGHIFVTTIDGDPVGIAGIRDGYIDATPVNDPYLHVLIAFNVAVHILNDLPYESDYLIDPAIITADNVDDGGLWGDLPMGEYAEWPYVDQEYCPLPE